MYTNSCIQIKPYIAGLIWTQPLTIVSIWISRFKPVPNLRSYVIFHSRLNYTHILKYSQRSVSQDPPAFQAPRYMRYLTSIDLSRISCSWPIQKANFLPIRSSIVFNSPVKKDRLATLNSRICFLHLQGMVKNAVQKNLNFNYSRMSNTSGIFHSFYSYTNGISLLLVNAPFLFTIIIINFDTHKVLHI